LLREKGMVHFLSQRERGGALKKRRPFWTYWFWRGRV
jgi:hypothetical protein